MKTLRIMYSIQAKLAIREFSGVLFGVLVPVGLMMLLGTIYEDMDQIGMSFGAISTLGISSAGLMGLPLSLSDFRQRKILKRYRVTPISPATLLWAQLLFCFTLSLVSTLLVYLVAVLMFGYGMVGSVWVFLLVFLLVIFSIHAIGAVVASLAPSSQVAGVVASALYFPMIFLSGATIPLDIMPTFLQHLAQVLPLAHGIQLLQAASLGEPLPVLSMFLLVALAIIGSVLAVKTFKWE